MIDKSKTKKINYAVKLGYLAALISRDASPKPACKQITYF